MLREEKAPVGITWLERWGARGLFPQNAVHYPMLVGSAYALPLLLWHWGTSGSAPLLMTVAGHPFEKIFGVVTVDKTIFSGYAIGLSVLFFVFALVVAYLLHPKPEYSRGIEQYTPEVIKEGKGGER